MGKKGKKFCNKIQFTGFLLQNFMDQIFKISTIVETLVTLSTGSRHYRNGGQGRKGPSQAFYGHYKLLRMATLGLGQKSWFLQFLSPSKIFIANGHIFSIALKAYFPISTEFLHSSSYSIFRTYYRQGNRFAEY